MSPDQKTGAIKLYLKNDVFTCAKLQQRSLSFSTFLHFCNFSNNKKSMRFCLFEGGYHKSVLDRLFVILMQMTTEYFPSGCFSSAVSVR